MTETLKVGGFDLPMNQRVLLICKHATFADALIQRVEGEVLFFEARNNVGKRRFFQVLVDSVEGVEYEP